MSDAASWQVTNAQYLDAALAWLRALLASRAGRASRPTPAPVTPAPAPPAPAAPVRPPEQSRSFWRGLRLAPPAQPAPVAAPASTALLLTASPEAPNTQSVEDAAAALALATTQGTPPPALLLLSQRLGLSEFERDVLLLCAAMELDTGIGALCAAAQGDVHRNYPTFALALALFENPSWDVLSPERPLRYWRLIEINQPGNQPLTVSALRADERIVSFLKGLSYLDDRLSPLVTLMDAPADGETLPPSQQAAVEQIVDSMKKLTPGQTPPAVQLLGADSVSKQLVAAHAALELGLRVYRLPAALLPNPAGDLDALGRLWQRESLLSPLALYVDGLASDAEQPSAGQGSPVHRLLARMAGVVFVDSRDVLAGMSTNTLAVDVAKPTPAEQKSAWAAVLQDPASAVPGQLAAQFNLSLAAIQQIAHQTLASHTAADPPAGDRLWSACLAGTRPRLDTLAQRIDPKATWDDLVLPAAEATLLHQISAQVGQRGTVYDTWGFGAKMSRGFGISALFAGETGTGKTMAAEVIANELRLNLYRIDLSAVVSKYIGETEKNLRRLFDAAEDGGAILFFDEADALFGKRSEVKDSHDRYANIEINYLLQRMEAYKGLAILATNQKSALDTAFMRRLRFVVTFPFPSAAERKIIWQKVFPSQTPTKDLDFDRLSRFNMTGGNIYCVALNAAFQAAQTGVPVTMPLIIESARTELRKLGRVVNELEFRTHSTAPPTKGTTAA
jgi:hypothetical protein